MRGFTDEAVILRKEDFGEADRILTAYTKDHGKIKILAKGVRRPTSRKGGNLDLLNHVKVQLHRGRSMHIATEASSINSFSLLKRDVKSISKAYYLCEIVDRLCPEEENMPFVFELLISTLSQFQNNSTKKIWEFEYRLLRHLGFITEGNARRKLRFVIEEIIERELKTPNFYYSLLNLD